MEKENNDKKFSLIDWFRELKYVVKTYRKNIRIIKNNFNETNKTISENDNFYLSEFNKYHREFERTTQYYNYENSIQRGKNELLERKNYELVLKLQQKHLKEKYKESMDFNDIKEIASGIKKDHR